MQAASRESYAAAEAVLTEQTGTADPATLAATGEQVLDVAALLAREPRLRRAVSDPARAGRERAGLLRSLVEGKVDEPALALLGTLAAGRWSTSGELLEATERLGVEALLASAERDGELAEVEDELFRFGQVVDGDPRLAAAVGDPAAPAADRAALVRSLLDGKARPVTVRLAEQAVRGYGGRGFPAGLTRLVEQAAQRRDRQVAYVTVAEPLTEADERRLGERLAELYGREVSVRMTVDPQILGGVRVRVGSDLYDGTILRRLNDITYALARR